MRNKLGEFIRYLQMYRAIKKSGLFDREYYLRNNLDVARECMSPLNHFLRHGWKEGRNPNPYFDTNWYLNKHGNEIKDNNPLFHYHLYGYTEGHDPSPKFSTSTYLMQHPDITIKKISPLSHFMKYQAIDCDVKRIRHNELSNGEAALKSAGDIAIHAHIYYPDLAREFAEYINNMPCDFDCYITTDTEAKKNLIQKEIGNYLKARKTEIFLAPNVGRDIAPFIVGCRSLFSSYSYVCHIHTKKSLHVDFGNRWRKYLLDRILGSQRQIKGIIAFFERNARVGLIYPAPFFPGGNDLSADVNRDRVLWLKGRLGLNNILPKVIAYPAGSMFWMRTKAFERLQKAGFDYNDFEPEEGLLDGTLAHAFERMFVYIARENGFMSRML